MPVTLPLSIPEKRKKPVQREQRSFRWTARQGVTDYLRHAQGNSRTTAGKGNSALKYKKIPTFDMISFITQIVSEELLKAVLLPEKGCCSVATAGAA